MGRLIDADEYEKRIKPYDTEDVMDKALYNFAHVNLITTPTAQPERSIGKWIVSESEEVGALGIRCKTYTCPSCGWDNSLIIPRNFCPNCGARLAQEGEDNDS